MAGRTSIQALTKKLSTDQFHWAVEKDYTGHITYLFFAFKESLALYYAYPEVFLLDCIYKTNKFKMPLLIIVGSTSLNTSFYVAFVFLRHEQEENFCWALQYLKAAIDTSCQSAVLVIDRDLALMNIIASIFLDTAHLFC